MKAAVVLVCLAVLVAIVHCAPVENAEASAPNKHELARKTVHELESLEKKASGNHKLLHDAEFRKEAGKALAMAKKGASHLKHKQLKKAEKKVARDFGKKGAKQLLSKLKSKK
ncbi:Hypp191 [Branchiostoma lanceolatum]|uniref:Hypp191 protein n=1 Tax=Branchiostoma lanceolatum TaxID=7740 RepID=A0A8J9YMD8_BRALA|nr:Hypp191 [Branchiostoma lanceolatum]